MQILGTDTLYTILRNTFSIDNVNIAIINIRL